ncbi:cytochrome c-type biogenesis protein [Labrys wisconsinensis]|uniref:Cytochrome c-type biogenesis protein n=1 Tax=Labrys wisconsinensis TaxID=425677 RepID=A0ABU0J649_9HYPH|nr:cytochrome c-type biogenesis protein [Labrys wisconsinensis]MDQ0469734.1 cytochrome c-type biogenesis protein CcmH [Labrys wisconsinensis]
MVLRRTFRGGLRRAGGQGLAAVLLAAAVLASPALAVQPDEMLKQPALEARARALSAELRCMVCQNQSIDDSDAPLAKDLRILVRERLVAGDSDAQVKDFLVQRYGDFILLKPPLEWRTVILWTAPFALLLAGLAGALVAARRRQAAPSPLTDEEQRRLDEIVGRP